MGIKKWFGEIVFIGLFLIVAFGNLSLPWECAIICVQVFILTWNLIKYFGDFRKAKRLIREIRDRNDR